MHRVNILLKKSCLSCIRQTISAAKFRLSRILQKPTRFKRNLLKMNCSTTSHYGRFDQTSAASFQVIQLIIMMKEKTSMLAHFQKLCKTLNRNSLKFSLYRQITWFGWALEARITQNISCYHESENTDALISMCCSALQHLIFRHRQNFSPRGLMFLDLLNTLDRRPRPKSLRSAGLSGRF